MKKISYEKLWKKCDKQKLRRVELFRDLGMSTQTLNAFLHDKVVSLRSIDKLCTYFKCQPDELMELIDE